MLNENEIAKYKLMYQINWWTNSFCRRQAFIKRRLWCNYVDFKLISRVEI